MAIEKTRNGKVPLELASAIEAFDNAKSEKEAVASSIGFSAKQPYSGSLDFADRERKVLRDELDQARYQYKGLMTQYEELYEYCDSFLKDAGKRRKQLEEEKESLNRDITSLKAELSSAQARQQESEKQFVDTNSKLAHFTSDYRKVEKLLAQKMESLSRLTEEVIHLRNSMNEARKQIDLANQREEQLKKTLGMLESQHSCQELAVDRALKTIADTVRTVDGLCASISQYFERMGSSDNSVLTPKAGKILAEQLKIEVRNLRSLQHLLQGPPVPPKGLRPVSDS
jgi:chromosome segregation ATPase